jgi:hypothetical protein
MLGWPAFNIGQANINPNLKYEDDLQEVFANKTIINKLVENNRADLELYQEALNLRAKRCKESSLLQPVLVEWNRAQYRIRQILKGTNIRENSSCKGTGKTAMNEWQKTFLFKGKSYITIAYRLTIPRKERLKFR